MSDLSQAATTHAADAATGDHPLVQGLRERHAKLSARDGWADRTLGRLGLFRGLEWLIARWSGAQPQRNDHEWLRRFGRKVMGRRRSA